MARTSYKTVQRWFRARHLEVQRPPRLVCPTPTRRLLPRPHRGQSRSKTHRLIRKSRAKPAKAPNDESFTAVHSAACRHHVTDGWRVACGLRGLPAAARFRAAAGGLPDDPDSNVLSRRESRCYGFLG